MEPIETEKILTAAEMFEIVGDELREKNAEIERLREENNDLKSALMNVLFSEVSHVEITEFTKEKE